MSSPPRAAIVQLAELMQQGDIRSAETHIISFTEHYPTFSSYTLTRLKTFRLKELRQWLESDALSDPPRLT